MNNISKFNLFTIILSNMLSGFARGLILIGIAWNITENQSTPKFLGMIIIVATFLLLFIGPNWGVVIDTFHKKSTLILIYLSSTIFYLTFLIILKDNSSLTLMAILYIGTMIFSQIHFPTQSSLVQQLFSKKYYGKINSILEVQVQVTQMIAGLAAGMIIDKYGVTYLLIVVIICFLIASLIFSFLKYTENEISINKSHTSYYKKLREGFKFFYTKKFILIFGISSFIPFIILMISNYTGPLYVKNVLVENIKIYSLCTTMYAIGSLISGILASIFINKINLIKFIIINTCVFSLFIFLICIIPNNILFIFFYLYLGLTVSSSRLVSQTILMNLIPSNIIGRAISSIELISVIIRLIIILFLTSFLDTSNIKIAYLLLFCVSLLSIFGYIYFNYRQKKLSDTQ
ncbi:MFS transporter [Macrococcus capreoli]|uniref:MFS transporter n=2 Tax=Macrococcus capreoli TaxID=2982690 RepID=UPI003EE58B0E